MNLLGQYNSNISSFLYQGLLDLFQASLAAGGQGGAGNVTQADLQALLTQANSNSPVPLPSAGQRTSAEQFNYPLNLLGVKYQAIQNELAGFIATSDSLLTKLNIQIELLDKLIAQAALQQWLTYVPVSTKATSFAWDYNQGIGSTSTNIANSNPANGVVYPPNANIATVFNVASGIRTGLLAPSNDTVVQPVNLLWTYNSKAQSQTVYSNNSAQLSLLEDAPLVTYLPNPNITVSLPIAGSIQNVFAIAGSTSSGPINTYVRTGFYPRSSYISVQTYNAVSNTFVGWQLTNAMGTWPLTTALTESFVGTLKSPLFQNAAGQPASISAGDYLYIETTVEGTILAQPMAVYLDCFNNQGTLIGSVQLSNPTASSSSYVWYQEVQIPTAYTAVSSAVLRYVTTDNNWKISNPRVHTPISVSIYDIDVNSLNAYQIDSTGRPVNVLNSYTQFFVDENNRLTFYNVSDGIDVYLSFSEEYPYYQCSLNQTDWSPMVMLDPDRPYPDDQPITHLVKPVNGAFPITNERGMPTGLTLTMVGQPLYSYQFIVGVQANPTWGEQATLEIQLASTQYIDQLNLKPFTNFFPKLTKVIVQGFDSSSQQVVFTGSQEIHSELRIEFPRQLVGTVFLTFIQEGYTAKDYQITDVNYVRRTVLQQLQTVLPPAAQRQITANYVTATGYEYDLGLTNIYAVDSGCTTGVTVSGPYLYSGQPTIVTLNSLVTGTVAQYLYYTITGLNGSVVESNTTGIALTSGQGIILPYTTATDTIGSVEFYIKQVLLSSDASVTRYVLQVNNNV